MFHLVYYAGVGNPVAVSYFQTDVSVPFLVEIELYRDIEIQLFLLERIAGVEGYREVAVERELVAAVNLELVCEAAPSAIAQVERVEYGRNPERSLPVCSEVAFCPVDDVVAKRVP